MSVIVTLHDWIVGSKFVSNYLAIHRCLLMLQAVDLLTVIDSLSESLGLPLFGGFVIITIAFLLLK